MNDCIAGKHGQYHGDIVTILLLQYWRWTGYLQSSYKVNKRVQWCRVNANQIPHTGREGLLVIYIERKSRGKDKFTIMCTFPHIRFGCDLSCFETQIGFGLGSILSNSL